MTMNAREMLATYLTFGNEAARELRKHQPNTPQWDAVANGVITSFTLVAVLADLRAVDPDRADALVAMISDVLDDSETAAGLLLQWGHTMNRNQDFRLTAVPDPDEDGEFITPEELAHQQQQASYALQQLARFDQEHANRLHANWHDLEHPTTADDVIREAGIALQHHESTAAQASPAYREHHEPRRQQ